MGWKEISKEYKENERVEAQLRIAAQKNRRDEQEAFVRQKAERDAISVPPREDKEVQMIIKPFETRQELFGKLASLKVHEMLATMGEEVWGAGEVTTQYGVRMDEVSESTIYLGHYMKVSLVAKLEGGKARESLSVTAYKPLNGEIVLETKREVYDPANPHLATDEYDVSFPKISGSDPEAKAKLTSYFAEDMCLRESHYNYPLPYGPVAEVK